MKLSELRNASMGFDRAVLKPVFYDEDKKEAEEYRAVYNIDKEKIASMVSDKYNVVQHKMVVDAVTDAISNLNINSEATVGNAGNRIFVDIYFKDAKLYVQKGEEFVAGVRIVNSYDKTTGIMVLPRLKRLVCSNGMTVNTGWVKGYTITHTQKLVEDFQGTVEKMMKEMINSNEKLKAMVNDCIADSIEWELLKRIVGKLLIGRKKHTDEIMKEMTKTKDKRFSRWNLYNAITSYATKGEQIKPNVEAWLQTKAQKVLVTPLVELVPPEKAVA